MLRPHVVSSDHLKTKSLEMFPESCTPDQNTEGMMEKFVLKSENKNNAAGFVGVLMLH